MYRAAAIAVSLCLTHPLLASERCSEDAMIVFDGSGSMGEMGFNLLSEPRIFEAREAMARAIPPIADVRRLGLIVYGPGPAACDGVDLRFAPTAKAASRILSAIDVLRPRGDTPLTEAVATAANVLGHPQRGGTIVLVTDGKETCGGATCQVAADLASANPDLTIHVIGFRVQGDHFQYGEGYGEGVSVAACMAEETGGDYIAAGDTDALVAALSVTLGCPIYGALE